MSGDGQTMPLIILVAPSLSEQMSGEAIKALQIYEELTAHGVPVHQITHERCRHELSRKFPDMQVTYVRDTRFQQKLCAIPLLKWFMAPLFMYEAARIAQRMVDENPHAIVHYTSPISPVSPQFRVRGVPIVIGPINGNIHHPPAFRSRETWEDWARRNLMVPSQLLHRLFFSGKQTADVLLVAGGERTRQSLRIAGCRDSQFRDTLDSGIPNRLRDQPAVEHRGRNLRFVQNGRLVPHKGTEFVIKAMTRTRNPVELEVIGRGPSKPGLEQLTAELGLQDRVHFIE